MRRLLISLIIGLTILGLVYVSIPASPIPPPPEGSLISTEPADTESIYRKAYFTNRSREEIMSYYKSRRSDSIRLNHPPEEAVESIRDQTKSSWLEELVVPLKDTLYINGFYPTKPTEQINVEGVHYLAKITYHHIPSQVGTRATVVVLAALCSYLLLKEYLHV